MPPSTGSAQDGGRVLFLKNQFDSIGKVRAVKNTVAMAVAVKNTAQCTAQNTVAMAVAVKYTARPEGQHGKERRWKRNIDTSILEQMF